MYDIIKLLISLTDETHILEYDSESQDFTCVFCYRVIKKYVKRTHPHEYVTQGHAVDCPVIEALKIIRAS
jgi:hypothetical protein